MVKADYLFRHLFATDIFRQRVGHNNKTDRTRACYINTPKPMTVFLTADIPLFILSIIAVSLAFMRVMDDRTVNNGFFIVSTILCMADLISSWKPSAIRKTSIVYNAFYLHISKYNYSADSMPFQSISSPRRQMCGKWYR